MTVYCARENNDMVGTFRPDRLEVELLTGGGVDTWQEVWRPWRKKACGKKEPKLPKGGWIAAVEDMERARDEGPADDVADDSEEDGPAPPEEADVWVDGPRESESEEEIVEEREEGEDGCRSETSSSRSSSSDSSVVSLIDGLAGAGEEAAEGGGGGGGDDLPPLPPPLEAPAPLAPEPARAQVTFPIAGGRSPSALVWYTTGVFYAYCRGCKHGRCCKERVGDAAKGRKGGRPLGFLYWWLKQRSEWVDGAGHREDVYPTWAQRKAAREELKALPGSEVLFERDRERQKEEGEDSEPELCP